MRLNLKRTSGVLAIVGALLIAMGVVAFSQEGGRPQGPPPGPPPGGFRGGPHGLGGPGGPRDMLAHFIRELNLTDEQQAQVKKLVEGFEQSTKELRDQMRTMHESQPDPLSGGAFDEAAVRAAAQARANVQVELEVAHVRLMSQIYSLLTPEQKAQLAAKRQEFEQRRKNDQRN